MTFNRNEARGEEPAAGTGARAVRALVVIGALGLGALAGYALHSQLDETKRPPAANAAIPPVPWVAAAPGRVEPRSGEFRAGTSLVGRVAEVFVRVNDRVEEGEVLIRLDDEEARARLAAAEPEAGVRWRERDVEAATVGREDVRRAEDAFFAAERAAAVARSELDDALAAANRKADGADQKLADARRRFSDARERLQRERSALAAAQTKAGLPAPNRSESSLTAARAEVAVAQALLDKTRIRAPKAGTVLQVNAKAGEMVLPAAEQPLVVIGDLSAMLVKAEVTERDIAKIKLGQRAVVRSDAYPGEDFDGRVTALAPSLSAPRIGARGPRRPTDVEVLEVTIDLEGTTPLRPGMRVDVFFRRDR
jgi:HlyD family secretion protein